MNNRKNGTAFEQEFCKYLAEHGFWAHNMAQKASGQPFDVIAAKNGHTVVIDCKECRRDVFNLSRVEENQRLSMMLWKRAGNGDGWFALKLKNEKVYMMPYGFIRWAESKGQTAIHKLVIEQFCYSAEEWVNRW